jgi:ATP synthase protein I
VPEGDAPRSPGDRHRRLAENVESKAARRRRARQRGEPKAWFGLGMFGLIGWSVAIPTLAGTALGWWLDARSAGEVSWTLTFMLLGVAVGCLNAWYWVQQERHGD